MFKDLIALITKMPSLVQDVLEPQITWGWKTLLLNDCLIHFPRCCWSDRHLSRWTFDVTQYGFVYMLLLWKQFMEPHRLLLYTAEMRILSVKRHSLCSPLASHYSMRPAEQTAFRNWVWSISFKKWGRNCNRV